MDWRQGSPYLRKGWLRGGDAAWFRGSHPCLKLEWFDASAGVRGSARSTYRRRRPIAAITNLYREILPPGGAILDLLVGVGQSPAAGNPLFSRCRGWHATLVSLPKTRFWTSGASRI